MEKKFTHLKTFESFEHNSVESIDEIFGGKLKKAKNKFKEDNKDLFDELKIAEKELKKEDDDSKKNLANIQKKLYSKLVSYTKRGGELMELLNIDRIDSDHTTVRNDLRDIIFNIQAFDDRSVWQKYITGAGAGRKGWTADK